MRLLAVITLLTVSSLANAATDKPGDAKLFQCMDKTTFAINSECVSEQVEANLVFKQVQETVVQNAEQAGDRAIATMTFDPKTLNIEIVAHRDAHIAKLAKLTKQ